MESTWSPPTSSTKRARRLAVSAVARGRPRCCRSRKNAATARSGSAGRGILLKGTTRSREEELTMRQKEKNGPLSVQAIAGTHVVLLGMDRPAQACAGTLGFAIRRHAHPGRDVDWMR